MMNVKISQKRDNVYHNRNNYKLKSIYDDEKECINYTLSWPLRVYLLRWPYGVSFLSKMVC